MITEIDYAVKFLVNMIRERCLLLSEEQLCKFETRTTELLKERYENHWYDDKPMKGSAFRCINVSLEDNSVDTVLKQAAEEVNLNDKNLFDIFNKGLSLWVDPNDVSCRLGKGSIFPVYKKISEKKSKPLNSNAPEFNSNANTRSQQRPRSTSPQHFINSEEFIPKQRSLTPPGFSSKDCGIMFERNMTKSGYSSDNLHKLWDTIPNSSSSLNVAASTYSPVSYASSNTYTNSNSGSYFNTPSQNFYSTQSYTPSTNSYMSYETQDTTLSSYKPDSSYSFNQYSSYYNPASSYWKKNRSYARQQKPLWQDDETYNRYHWDSSRQAQEAF